MSRKRTQPNKFVFVKKVELAKQFFQYVETPAY